MGKHHLLCLDKLPPAISTTSITSSIPHARCRREHECREAQAGLNLTQTNRIEGHRAQRTPQSSLRAAENTSSASDTAQHCGAANCLEAGQARNSTPGRSAVDSNRATRAKADCMRPHQQTPPRVKRLRTYEKPIEQIQLPICRCPGESTGRTNNL